MKSPNRNTCAHCGSAGGSDYRLTVECARRAGVQLIAGAWHLHHACARLLTRKRRAVLG